MSAPLWFFTTLQRPETALNSAASLKLDHPDLPHAGATLARWEVDGDRLRRRGFDPTKGSHGKDKREHKVPLLAPAISRHQVRHRGRIIGGKLADLRFRIGEIAAQAVTNPEWDGAPFVRDFNQALKDAEG